LRQVLRHAFVELHAELPHEPVVGALVDELVDDGFAHVRRILVDEHSRPSTTV